MSLSGAIYEKDDRLTKTANTGSSSSDRGPLVALKAGGYLPRRLSIYWKETRMADVQKYIEDIKKYASTVNEEAVAGIVRHCGIALRNRDSSLVAGTDPEELKRVRESWLKKKLALTESDADLDKAIHEVMQKMKADRAKGRVTVYYLLAEHFKKLDGLVKPAAAPKAAKSAGAAPKKTTWKLKALTGAAIAQLLASRAFRFPVAQDTLAVQLTPCRAHNAKGPLARPSWKKPLCG